MGVTCPGVWAWRGKHPRHGHYRRLRGLYVLLLCQRQVRENSPSSYATKQNRRKLLKAYSDKGEELSLMLYLPEETGWPSAPAPAGCCWWARRRSRPRPPATARAWPSSPEKEPAHCLRRPGGHAGAGQPSPLPRPQPTRHGCSDPRRRRGRADEPAVKNSPVACGARFPPFVTCGHLPPARGKSASGMGALAWWQLLVELQSVRFRKQRLPLRELARRKP